jgi:hypothetical protein
VHLLSNQNAGHEARWQGNSSRFLSSADLKSTVTLVQLTLPRIALIRGHCEDKDLSRSIYHREKYVKLGTPTAAFKVDPTGIILSWLCGLSVAV